MRLTRVRLEGIVDAFNVLNTGNISSYGNVVGSAAYLTANQSGTAFYQPRQIQFGFRVSVLRSGWVRSRRRAVVIYRCV